MDQNDFEQMKGRETHSSDDDDEEEKDDSKAEEQTPHARDEGDSQDERDEENQDKEDDSNYQFAKNSQIDSEEEEPESLEDTEPEEVFEGLTPEESYTVVEEYVGERSSEVRKEVDAAPSESPEEAAALADAALLDEIRERLAGAGEGNEEVLDEALNQVADELELEVEEPEEATVTEPGEVPEEPSDDDEAVAVAPNPVLPPVPPTPNIPLPPIPPIPTPPPPPPIPGPPGPFRPWVSPPGSPINPNQNVNLPNSSNIPPPTPAFEAWQPRRSRAGDLLLGGIIGYMIGRRGGRKRTEKRLLPVQEKLEHEVRDLQFAVAEREQKIRRLAAEKFRREPEAAPKLVEKLKKRAAEKEAVRGKERAAKIIEKNADIKFGKFATPAAEILPERRRINEDTGLKPRIALEVMTVEQLLEVVAEAKVEGIFVTHMYEAGRLNEFGLRRVAIELLRGKHFEKVLSVYLLPDSGETIHQNLSPNRTFNITAAGQIVSEQNMSSRSESAMPNTTFPASSPMNLDRPPVLRKPPKIYPSVIGMAAGLLLLLLLLVYMLLN